MGAGVSERRGPATSRACRMHETWHGMEGRCGRATYSKPIPMVASLVGSPSYIGKMTVGLVVRYVRASQLCCRVDPGRSRWSGVAATR